MGELFDTQLLTDDSTDPFERDFFRRHNQFSLRFRVDGDVIFSEDLIRLFDFLIGKARAENSKFLQNLLTFTRFYYKKSHKC